MRKISYPLLIIMIFAIGVGIISFYEDLQSKEQVFDEPTEMTSFEKKHVQSANERYKIIQELTYKVDGKNYTPGYKQREIKKLKEISLRSRSNNSPVDMMERGPANVPGRARGLVVLPQDATHQTWLVGSSGGGIWKTTNAGSSWIDVSPEFPTLAITSLAYCETSPDIIYAGSGEYIASAFTPIGGDGMFKSTDGGETWTHLTSSAASDDWQSVTRVIVDPNNPDVVLASTAPNFWGTFESHIFKSTDGGVSWTSMFESNAGAIEQIISDPSDFNRIYACQRGVGVLASDNAGDTWTLISEDLSVEGRLELAVSPVNTSRLYVSAVGNITPGNTDIFYSDNGGINWIPVLDDNNTIDVLGAQGWYDNTILADPFDLDEFYVGGIGIYKYSLDTEAGVTESDPSFIGSKTGGTEVFMTRISFGSADLDGGTIKSGSASSDLFTSVEIRFGAGISQKAHRFLVPEGSGSGVGDSEYTYQDYVDVPFQVWDVDAVPPRQLMVAFRDQGRDGKFNLINSNTDGAAIDQSREYLYINSRDYSNEPSPEIAINGGHVSEDLYFIWPVLVGGASWDSENLPESTFEINWGTILSGKYTVQSVADPYGDVDGKNSNVHPDHHNLVAVIHDETAKTWQIINSNDGATYSSNIDADPGVSSGDWQFAGSSMNTTQFYGADKAPGEDRYVAGAQDNGSWVTPSGGTASKTTNWIAGWGGDGFDAVWNPGNINQIIVTNQSRIGRSTNGGQSFSEAMIGIIAAGRPFIGQFANSPQFPNHVYTVGENGVYKSTNFGGEWKLIDLSDFSEWTDSSLINIEISDATSDVVWAGARVGSGSLFLSTDKGKSFNPVPSNDMISGLITGIGTHPVDHKTVYVLLAYADSPKVLRSEDLGQTWEDISGFDPSSTSTGFPDVAVYDIQVMPHDPSTIWVGSEIGVIESNDNGATWHMLDTNLPMVSVWDFKIKDDQIVIATHGRGVWSYTMPETPMYPGYPLVSAIGEATVEEISVSVTVTVPSLLDELKLYINGEEVEAWTDVAIGETTYTAIFTEDSELEIYAIGFIEGAPFTSDEIQLDVELASPPLANSDAARIAIYPNPTSDFVYFESKSELENVQLLSIDGKIVTPATDENKLDLSGLNTGIYILNFEIDGAKMTRRLIKK